MTYRIELTELDSTTAAHLHRRTTTADIGTAVGKGFEELYAFVMDSGAEPGGPPQASYPGDFQPGADIDLDLYVPIRTASPARGHIDVVTLPGGPAARTSHQGPYEEIGAAYDAVFEWIHEHGHQPAGPARELYLNGPDSVPDPAGYLTEVVVPLRAG